MKKVLLSIGTMLLITTLFVGCGGNGGDSDGGVKHITIDESDITESTNTVSLSDGNWKFIYKGEFPDEPIMTSKDSGKCVVSVSESKITLISAVEENNGLIRNVSPASLEIMNTRDYYHLFVTRPTDNLYKNWTIKTNANNSKYKMTATFDENTESSYTCIETIVLEKIE